MRMNRNGNGIFMDIQFHDYDLQSQVASCDPNTAQWWNRIQTNGQSSEEPSESSLYKTLPAHRCYTTSRQLIRLQPNAPRSVLHPIQQYLGAKRTLLIFSSRFRNRLSIGWWRVFQNWSTKKDWYTIWLLICACHGLSWFISNLLPTHGYLHGPTRILFTNNSGIEQKVLRPDLTATFWVTEPNQTHSDGRPTDTETKQFITLRTV